MTWEPYRAANEPEPTPDASSMRASDADRDQVATLLSHAYAEGRITHDEHDERLDAAMRAKTFADLVPLTSDLVPLDKPLPPRAVATSPTTDSQLPVVDPSGATSAADIITSIFSEAKRLDQWRVRRHTQINSVFGGGKLDMRNAIFDDVELDLTGYMLFGDLKIIVPEGVDVRDETSAIFAETSIKGLRPRPGGPVLTLRGVLVFAEIAVRGPDHKPWWKLGAAK